MASLGYLISMIFPSYGFVLVLDDQLFIHQLVHVDKSSLPIIVICCLLLFIPLLNCLLALAHALLL